MRLLHPLSPASPKHCLCFMPIRAGAIFQYINIPQYLLSQCCIDTVRLVINLHAKPEARPAASQISAFRHSELSSSQVLQLGILSSISLLVSLPRQNILFNHWGRVIIVRKHVGQRDRPTDTETDGWMTVPVTVWWVQRPVSMWHRSSARHIYLSYFGQHQVGRSLCGLCRFHHIRNHARRREEGQCIHLGLKLSMTSQFSIISLHCM